MRKNGIVALAVAGLMLIASPAYALDIDLDSLSIEELMELRTQVAQKINEKVGSDAAPIASGVYVVGKDIREGTYYVSDTKIADKYFKVFLYEDEEAHKNREDMTGRGDVSYMKEGEDATISLHDGMVMEIEGGSAMIQEIKPSWAP